MSAGKNKAKAIKDDKERKRMQSYLKHYNYKAYILFMIGLATGYRGSDLIRLTVKDIREAVQRNKFIVVEQKIENMYKGKSKKQTNLPKKQMRAKTFEREAYSNEKLNEILREYIKGMEDSEYLYSSKKGNGKGKYRQHIRRDSLGKIFKKAAVDCGITDISVGTHTPRKTYGYIQYLENKEDINVVQELFGHSTPLITKTYIGIDDDVKKESAKIMSKYMD